MKTLTCTALIFTSVALIQAQNAPRVEPGLIQGTVMRAGTNEPLSDVQISLEGAVAPEVMQALLRDTASAGIAITPPPGASLSETTQLLISTAAARGLPIQAPGIQNLVTRAVGPQTWPTTQTDRDGRFLFQDVKPGRYTVRAVRDGFFGKPVNGTYPPTSWVDLVVAEKETKQAALSLVQGAIIGGRVLDTNGAALSNSQVQIFLAAYQTGFALLQNAIPGPVKTTDDRGEYRLFWLPPGDYYLGAMPPARAGGPGAAATLPSQNARTFYPSVSRMSDAIPITIRGGEDLRGMDITIRNGQLFKIAGTVTNSIPMTPNPNGEGFQPTTVFFHLANRDLGLPVEAGPANNYGNISLALNSGPFELSNIAPGSYEVLARVADPAAGTGLGGFSWGRAIVDIDDRDVRNVAITVVPPATVKGVIRTANGAPLPANLRVSLSPMGGSARVNLYTLTTARASTVERDGTFAVTSVQPGRFRIAAVSGLPPDFFIADVRQNAMSVFDSGFEIDSRAPNPLEIIVSNGAGVVDGLVEDGARKAVPGAIVALVPEARRQENRTLYATATADASGRFTFRGVAPGDYQLFAWDSTPPNAYQSPTFLKKFEGRSRPVRVAQQATATVEIPVIR